MTSFAIAAPIKEGKAHPPNLPWNVDADALARCLNLAHVTLINDLEASAYGIAVLEPQDFAVLNVGIPAAEGNAAVISAGRGSESGHVLGWRAL